MIPSMEQWVSNALIDTRVARLGTVGADGAVRLVPICFAVVDGFVVSALDHKPKRTGQLRRFRDIAESGTATVLVDHYEDDWSTLWWVRLDGEAQVVYEEPRRSLVLAPLISKYAQYGESPPTGPVIVLTVRATTSWSAAAGRGSS